MAATGPDETDRSLPRLAARFAWVVLAVGVISWLFQSNLLFLVYLLFLIASFVLAAIATYHLVIRRDGGIRLLIVHNLLALTPFLFPRISMTDMDGRQPVANHLLQLGMGITSHDEIYQHLPPAAIVDHQGTALLSWRVSLLPFIEYDQLWRKFKLNEPWDSPHNLPLSKQMPYPYMDSRSPEGTTPFQAFVGAGTAFETAPKPLSLSRDFPDGLASTFLFVDSPEVIPWTKPQDLAYDANKPLPPLGRAYGVEARSNRTVLTLQPYQRIYSKHGFLAAFADGSVRFIRSDISEQTLRAAIVRNDGQIPEWDEPSWDGRRDAWGTPQP